MIYNMLGLGLPFIAAIFSIPFLIANLGDSVFGILTLIWAVVSYFSLFDFGLGRSLTLELSIAYSKEQYDRILDLVFTSLIALVFLGGVAGVFMLLFIPYISVETVGQVDSNQIKWCILAMAVAMPAITLTSGLRGILESKGEFKLINLIRFPMGLYTFLGPVLSIIIFGNNLLAISIFLVVGRVLAMLVHYWFVMKLFHKEDINIQKGEFKKNELKSLVYSGGWMTVSNVVSPLMTYLDRFFIGSSVSTAAIAYYVTPQELISKLSIIPISITSVLFPTISGNIGNKKVQKELYWNTSKLLLLIMLPLISGFIFYSHEILALWISDDFADKSSYVMQIISVGMFFTCLAQVPFSLIQGNGYVRFTAVVHLIELPIYCVVMYVLGLKHGVEGVALAWTSRNIIDYLIMLYKAKSIIK